MVQSAMTVRLEPQVKREFEQLCGQFGMSVNTAINVFVHAVVNSGSIPFEIVDRRRSSRVRRQAQDAFDAIRAEVAARNEEELTLEEINAEINAVREHRFNR